VTDTSLATLAERELEQCVVMVLREEPFYGHLLGSVVRRLDAQIPTAAVTLSPLGVSLVVNPHFFMEELTRPERCAVIKHEILHLVLKHLFRFEAPGTDRLQLNIAADLVVNQLVHPWPLPTSAITLASFPELRLTPNKTVEHYYRRLTQHAAGQPDFDSLLRSCLSGSHSHHGRWAAAGGEGFTSENAQSGSPPSSCPEATAPQLSEDLARILEDAFDRQLQRARARLSARQWGELPGSLRTLLERTVSEASAQVNWTRALRLFASSGYRTRVIATNRKRSKRFGTYPGVRICRERRLAVVVDTSGSIGPEALAAFFREIALIHRTGTEVLVIEADAAVQKIYPYRGRPPDQAEGGGGTDFDPAFQWLRNETRQAFDGCIYLTDGFAESPKVRPPCRLLWVVTPEGATGSHLPWGKCIRMAEP
jgi:predicted metal-dependent peptidase